MEHNDEYTKADLSRDLEALILAGLIEVKGVTEEGELLYGLTKKFPHPLAPDTETY
jgi:hypothetical protein